MKAFGVFCGSLLVSGVLASACTQDFDAFQFTAGGAAGAATLVGTGGKASTGGSMGTGGQSKTGGTGGMAAGL